MACGWGRGNVGSSDTSRLLGKVVLPLQFSHGSDTGLSASIFISIPGMFFFFLVIK